MNRRLLTLLATSLLWIGCQGRLFTVHLDRSDEFTVEQGSIVEQFLDAFGLLEFLDMDLTTSQELQDQGVQPGDIEGVYFDRFVLQVLRPQGEDLSFLDAMSIYLEAPGVPSVLVASAASFPEGVDRVEFQVQSDEDITAHLVSRSMTLTTEVNGHRPSEDIDIEASFSLSVGVTGQGACNHLTGGGDSGG